MSRRWKMEFDFNETRLESVCGYQIDGHESKSRSERLVKYERERERERAVVLVRTFLINLLFCFCSQIRNFVLKTISNTSKLRLTLHHIGSKILLNEIPPSHNSKRCKSLFNIMSLWTFYLWSLPLNFNLTH